MFLQLNHQKLDVYDISLKLVSECYKLTRLFPSEEKFSLSQQIRRAAISILLNISEGCSRKSETERKRFFEIARGSLIEIDAALDIALTCNYFEKQQFEQLGIYMNRCFGMLTRMQSS
ncbi:MAG TPA: four helix bundle protein [Flavisolibacter sp.]|jgi:four helix bundle protein|nr:four helix bundle protein [Flavisolibacter sp.]